MKKTHIINLYGLPNAGKSTTAAYIFYSLKKLGYSVEFNLEVAKKHLINGTTKPLEDPIYMLGAQHRLIDALYGEVDFIVTDAPLPLIESYAKLGNKHVKEFTSLVKKLHGKYRNIDIELVSNFKYDRQFRVDRDEEEKQKIKDLIQETFVDFNITPIRLEPDFSIEEILIRVNK